jgi:hypothetical protein
MAEEPELPGFQFLMRLQGIGDHSSVSTVEIDAYLTPMKGPAAAGPAGVITVPGKHFPREDQAPAIARRIADQALRPHPGPIGRQ